MSPTARTLAECRKHVDWVADVTERWISIPGHPGGGIRKDWCGFGDVIALTPEGILIIQATSGSNSAKRVTKIKTECAEALRKALATPHTRVQVWAWTKYAKKVDGRSWRVRITDITMEGDNG